MHLLHEHLTLGVDGSHGIGPFAVGAFGHVGDAPCLFGERAVDHVSYNLDILFAFDLDLGGVGVEGNGHVLGGFGQSHVAGHSAAGHVVLGAENHLGVVGRVGVCVIPVVGRDLEFAAESGDRECVDTFVCGEFELFGSGPACSGDGTAQVEVGSGGYGRNRSGGNGEFAGGGNERECVFSVVSELVFQVGGAGPMTLASLLLWALI